MASARAAVDLIQDRCSGDQQIRLSAAELFLSAVDEEIVNSRGLRAEGRSTSALLELVLLAQGDGEEVEFFRHAEARRLEDLRLGRARLRRHASRP